MFRLTPVIKTLLILNAIIYVFTHLFEGFVFAGIPFSSWFQSNFALMPWNGWLTNAGPLEFHPWQLLTYQFLHGGFAHIFFNMLMLWMFGSELEELWGSAKFLIFYLLCGIGAGIVHMFMSMFLGQIAPTIGASGSIYGLFFSVIMLNPNRRMIIFPIFIPLKAKWIGIGMMSISVLGGLFGADGIAHFAHLGGGLMGMILVKIGEKTPIFNIARKFLNFGIESNEYLPNNKYQANRYSTQSTWDVQKKYSAKWEEPKRYQAQDGGFQKTEQATPKAKTSVNIGGQNVTQADIDTILDKISQAGYASLTEQEKYILTEISKKM